VVALLQGHLLVVANVGDSDCVLGGLMPDGSIGFEQLCADHSPMSNEEYVRVARLCESREESWEPALFLYDYDEEVLEIFAVSDDGEVALDEATAQSLDEKGVGFKTARGDRPSALVVPETADYGQQKLAMTRSLGDFYMQYHGAVWEPSVSCIDLFDLVSQLSKVTLVIASDGLWDVHAYKDVLKFPLKAAPATPADPADTAAPPRLRATDIAPHMRELMMETREESADLFGERADNITAICVCFDVIAPTDPPPP